MNSPATAAMTADNTQKTKEKWKLAWSATRKSEYFAANTATDTIVHTTEKKTKTTLDYFYCLFFTSFASIF